MEVYVTDSKRMRGTLFSGAVASSMIVVIMAILTFFLAGGNAWFGISAGTLVMMFSYTNNLTLRFNMLTSANNLTLRFNMLTSVMQNINHALGDAHDMTVILDAHRLSTVASLDRIVVLKNGEIVEDGVHSELIAAGGEYADQLAACGFLITFLLSQSLSGTRKPSYIFQCVCSRPFSDSECV